MGVVDKLNQIKSCKEDIKQAIIDKGVDMSDVAFTEYATKISEIQAGGGITDYLDYRAELSTYYSTTKMVGNCAFAYCTSLQSIDLPNCTSVGSSAFYACKSLQSVNLPNCSSVGDETFYRCSSLQSINSPMCEYVGDYVFARCSSLQTVNLPNCYYVSNYAFTDCISLQSVNLPNCGIVNCAAFEGCKSLQTVNLPNCYYVSNYAFRSCSSLSVLDLRSTYSCVLSQSDAFSRTPFASGIGSIYVHAAHLSQFQKATNWTYFSKCFVGVGDPDRQLLAFDSGRVYGDTYGLYSRWTSFLGVASSSVTSIDLPNVKNLSASALFSIYFSNLTSVSMNNLVSAPNYMCYSCKSLQTVNLPNCVSVGISAFMYCSSLQTVNLPNCVSVGSSAFYACKSLQSVNLPKLETVYETMFEDLYNLTSVNLPNCVSVGTAAFQYCSSLQTVNLPMCEYIDAYAFTYCSSLQSIDLPNCVSVGISAFQYCSSLQTVNLPMCEYIGNNALYTYKNTIDEVYIGTSISKVCQTGGGEIFGADGYGGYYINKIFVPMSLVDAYKSATTWSNFASKIFGI